MSAITGTWGFQEKRCGAKAGLSNERAHELARKMSFRSGELIVPYACVDCGTFHVGHASLEEQKEFKKYLATPEQVPCDLCGKLLNRDSKGHRGSKKCAKLAKQKANQQEVRV